VTEDFQMLKNIVVEMRSQEKINSWIQEKQKKTYVRINPEWRDCDFQYPYWAK
jgi:peptidyl-prolyl cis-trans isomerase SurA